MEKQPRDRNKSRGERRTETAQVLQSTARARAVPQILTAGTTEVPIAEFYKGNYYRVACKFNKNSTEFTEHLVIPK